MGKSVRWSTITVYEFGVAIGGSAVPKRGGPAVGLARRPECVWSTRVDELDTSDSESDAGSEEDRSGSDRRQRLARKRRVRWLKPLERVTMLEKAGCSEERIYRTMMESSEIAMSRRLSLSVQRSVVV
ncbi:hypothetical protein PybrP1_009741 [[Pythium] brassicae (nom. inval.)]|nr:hypothetical protein PybrP1_009741 [[Pythium] brassicae (nom. inval.)]